MKRDAILVTGAGQRLGLHLAEAFLERGHDVIATYRTDRPAVQRLRDAGVDTLACDFLEAGQIDDLVEHVRARYVSLRALIHNASAWLPDDAGPKTEAVMNRMMRVHVTAPYRLNLELAPLLEACSEPHADIIHVGDYVSSRGSRKHVAYAASKAAQDNLTLSFAAKLAPKVKVNSIAPALVLFNEGDDARYRARAVRKNLMGREGGAGEFLHAVDYLLDSAFVTGRVLPMDGGRHLQQQH